MWLGIITKPMIPYPPLGTGWCEQLGRIPKHSEVPNKRCWVWAYEGGGGVFKGWGGGPLPLKPLKRLNTPRGLTMAKGSPVGITQSGQDCGHTNRECHLVYCILSFSKAALNFGLFCHVCKTNMLFVLLLEGRRLFILPLLRP